MGLFDRFRRKEEDPDLDPIHDLVLEKLEMGYLVDYDLQTWVVTDHSRYTYNDGRTAREWELTSGRDKRYLELAQGDEGGWSLSKSIPMGAINSAAAASIRDHILERENPPDEVSHKETTYYMEGSVGGYQIPRAGGRLEMILWEFMDEDEESFLSIVQWSETEFTAVCGILVEDYQFSNILPGETT